MPLTAKGEKIEAKMKKEYGSEKGESVFYASRNKGTISGVDSLIDGASALADRLKAVDAEEKKEENTEAEDKKMALAKFERELGRAMGKAMKDLDANDKEMITNWLKGGISPAHAMERYSGHVKEKSIGEGSNGETATDAHEPGALGIGPSPKVMGSLVHKAQAAFDRGDIDEGALATFQRLSQTGGPADLGLKYGVEGKSRALAVDGLMVRDRVDKLAEGVHRLLKRAESIGKADADDEILKDYGNKMFLVKLRGGSRYGFRIRNSTTEYKTEAEAKRAAEEYVQMFKESQA